MVEVLLGVRLDDRTLCSGFNFFLNFMLSYASIGGLGISVYRILYLKVKTVQMSCFDSLLKRNARCSLRISFPSFPLVSLVIGCDGVLTGMHSQLEHG